MVDWRKEAALPSAIGNRQSAIEFGCHGYLVASLSEIVLFSASAAELLGSSASTRSTICSADCVWLIFRSRRASTSNASVEMGCKRSAVWASARAEGSLIS